MKVDNNRCEYIKCFEMNNNYKRIKENCIHPSISLDEYKGKDLDYKPSFTC